MGTFFSAAVTTKVIKSPATIVVRYCRTGQPDFDDDCAIRKLKRGKKVKFPVSRSVGITVGGSEAGFCADERGKITVCSGKKKHKSVRANNPSCKDGKEDIAFEVRVDNAKDFAPEKMVA